jgi:hypothetical protein
MKKYFIILLIVLVSTIYAFSYNNSTPNFSTHTKANIKRIPSTNDLMEMFYRERIPEEFCSAFLYYTKDDPTIRPDFYSIMVHESANFTAFVNKNKNGSYDYGPSQLNSDNLKNDYFMWLYDPKDKSMINSTYTHYMVITINFYKDLVRKYGKDYALYAYNGGERCVGLIKNESKDPKYTSLLANVKAYNKNVTKQTEQTVQELTEYVDVQRKLIVEGIDIYTKFLKSHNMTILENNSSIQISRLIENVNKSRNDTCLYFFRRRKNFTNFEQEKFEVERHSIIHMLKVKFA